MKSLLVKTAAVALALAGFGALSVPASALTFSVLHTFTGGADGANPLAGLTLDKSGNVYGTAQYGGTGYGTAFKLKHSRTGWNFELLYTFASGSDGAAPAARIVPGPQGHLFGTTAQGGGGGGTVFELGTSPKHSLNNEKQLYRFLGSNGYEPSSGDLTFDAAGNIYGTTSSGGANGQGSVFELIRTGHRYQETVLHSFGAGSDGAIPIAGVVFDSAGNLYGTTSAGGAYGYGAVFQLTPTPSGWTENVVYSFQNLNDGEVPYAGLTFDKYGNLYGAATEGGTSYGGTLFVLTPSSGGWAFNTVYSSPVGGSPDPSAPRWWTRQGTSTARRTATVLTAMGPSSN